MIDWESNAANVLINPRYPADQIKMWEEQLNFLPAHIWLQTSGSTGKPKFVALSKEAILTSAQAVNNFLESDASDTWIHTLPRFHVGGLGIDARAFLSGSHVIHLDKWDPEVFIQAQGTLTALVPTQLFDLVQKGVKSPGNLRAVIIGGGALDPILHKKALELGWPILPSYGLTECASQVATGNPLIPLSHIQLKIINDLIWIKSPSLLTTYATIDENVTLFDPRQDGWFQTEDRGVFDGDVLKVLGRSADFIKIGGESSNMQHLRSVFKEVKLDLNFAGEAEIFASEDSRLGHVIHLAIESIESKRVVEAYNERVLPFEKIRQVHSVSKIPWKSCLKRVVDAIEIKKR